MYVKCYNVHYCEHYKMTDKTKPVLPIPVTRALRKLGVDIRSARLRRRITTKTLAERAAISRTTLNKAEKGDPGVAMWVYASILFVLGLTDRLAKLAESAEDSIGLSLEEERLPQRIRPSKSFISSIRNKVKPPSKK